MTILVTGFSPFDGRSTNSSWVAASCLKQVINLQIPVIWGKPSQLLKSAVEKHQPNIVISMGEGREGRFDIETVARNERKQRRDDRGNLPPGLIQPDGPERRFASVDSTSLSAHMAARQIPIQVSEDAGAFLCEETLYCLETLKEQFAYLKTVVFVHLPPYGSSLEYEGRHGFCDDEILASFANLLLSCTKKVHAESRSLVE